MDDGLINLRGQALSPRITPGLGDREQAAPP